VQRWDQESQGTNGTGLYGDVKSNKKRFFKNISQKRQAKARAFPLKNVKGKMGKMNSHKAEVLSKFFASVLSARQTSLMSLNI